jgi:bifunctional UDP-N-acetylglucosamine pyrophosphorylase / glucosamine-1-phosphate N-acetyltransferase
MSEIAAIILAAGQGTRMKSDLHKVLHPIAGRPMIMHLMASVDALEPERKVVVVGSGKEQLEAALAGRAELAVQSPQHGTGHAVQQAEAALAGFEGDVLILYGDVPFVPTATMQMMIDRLNAPDAPAIVVLAFEPDNVQSYGRVIVDKLPKGNDRILKMVEHKDATPEERGHRLCNSGLMAVKARDLFGLLARVTNSNAAGEYYLVDIVNIANADGRHCAVVKTDTFDVTGINSRAELAAQERKWQVRRRRQMMTEGVTLIDPDTVWFAYNTIIGRDVVIEPNVFFGPGVMIADNVTIRAFSHIEGARIASGAEVGPYAARRGVG